MTRPTRRRPYIGASNDPHVGGYVCGGHVILCPTHGAKECFDAGDGSCPPRHARVDFHVCHDKERLADLCSEKESPLPTYGKNERGAA